MEYATIPRIPPAVLDQRALERWDGEAGARPVDPTPRPEAGRPRAAPQKKRAVRNDAPARDKPDAAPRRDDEPARRMIGEKDGGEGSSP